MLPHTTLVQQGQSGGNAVTAKRITFGYNALGQRTSIDRFQSTGTSNPVAETDFTFDGANRLASLTHVRGSTTLAGDDYSCIPLSRISIGTVYAVAFGLGLLESPWSASAAFRHWAVK